MSENFYILPAIKVNNFKNASTLIKNYWKKYLSLNLKNETIYAFYFNYNSNYKDDYNFSIGGKQYFNNSNIIKITKTNYKIFSCHNSNIIETWNNIWNLEENGKLKRSYTIDFEKHYDNGNIDIYIGIL